MLLLPTYLKQELYDDIDKAGFDLVNSEYGYSLTKRDETTSPSLVVEIVCKHYTEQVPSNTLYLNQYSLTRDNKIALEPLRNFILRNVIDSSIQQKISNMTYDELIFISNSFTGEELIVPHVLTIGGKDLLIGHNTKLNVVTDRDIAILL